MSTLSPALEPETGPLYLQLMQRLLDGVQEGRWQSGLPSERMLSRSLAVSRHTARRALDQLCQRGMLERRRGSGTYLAAPAATASTAAPGVEQAWTETPVGRRQWLARETAVAGAEELFALGLSPSARVARMQWLHAEAGVLAQAWQSLESHVLALHLLPRPEAFDGDVDALLAAQGLAPVRRLQRLRACNATLEQARLLGVGPGTALLHITRQSYAAQGQALLLSHSYRLGEAAGLMVELRRSA